MALSFIGKPISLISHSDVRYRGVLAGIDPAASTIRLSNVYSMGTESRRPPTEYIPPLQNPFQYIIFRASEVKDLSVDDPAPAPLQQRSVHDDPAVLGVSAPTPSTGSYSQFNNTTPSFPAAASSLPQTQPQTQNSAQPHQPTLTSQQSRPAQQQQQDTAANNSQPAQASRPQGQGRRNNSVYTAAASLETVERALGDLRVSNSSNANSTVAGPRHGTGNSHGHGRRGQHGQGRLEIKAGEIKVPATDFDFQSSNARFDKAALAPRMSSNGGSEREGEDDEVTNPSEQEDDARKEKEKEKEKAAYNPEKSFFDCLSSSTSSPSGRGGGGGGGGDGGGPSGRGGRRGVAGVRNRREEERERNVATFGEPGGVGLMGPGAYVGGYGGYGRRGSRPRRGVGVGRA